MARRQAYVPPLEADRVIVEARPNDHPNRVYYLGPRSTVIDGEVVVLRWWCKNYSGHETMIFLKPEKFDERKVCGSINRDGSLCQNDAKECTLHCGAWAKQIGGSCRQKPSFKMKRCRFHGGKTPSGVSSGAFKHGGYSNTLPANIREDYAKFMKLIDHLSLKPEVALLRVQIEQANRRMGTGETEKAWMDLKRIMSEFDDAVQKDDQQKTQEALVQLRKTIMFGSGVHVAAREARKIALDLSNIAARDSKIIANREMTMNQAEALALFQAVMESVKRRFGDNQKGLQEFTGDMQLLLEDERTRVNVNYSRENRKRTVDAQAENQ